jgi:hypothetical protein
LIARIFFLAKHIHYVKSVPFHILFFGDVNAFL